MASFLSRGLCNPTGTACHLSSAIIILACCLDPLRDCILLLARQNLTDDDVIHYLACLFHEILATDDDTDKEAAEEDLDPGKTVALLYKAIRKAIGIEANELGDSVTALIKLMQHICAKSSVFQSVWKQWADAGRVHSLFLGTKSGEGMHPNNREKGHVVNCSNSDRQEPQQQHHFRKESKIRSMAIPYPVPIGESTLSVLDAIRETLQPKIVAGYQWPNPEMLSTEDEKSINMVSLITTTKELYFDELPPFWLLHLDHFTEQGCSRPNGRHHSIDVPERIYIKDIWKFQSNNDNRQQQLDDDASHYLLIGGILHVDNSDANHNDNADEEGGHYVTVVRQRQNGDESQWFLVDDDQVSQVSLEKVLQMLSGSHADLTNTSAGFTRGVLLVYRQSIDPVQQDPATTVECADDIDWARPFMLINRRLRVKWAENKFFAGVVDRYDPTTGKHQVLYDDGDVRAYALRKKSVIWE